jgi:hypothetical protein
MRWKYLQVAGDEATEEFYQGDGRMRSVIVRINLHALHQHYRFSNSHGFSFAC